MNWVLFFSAVLEGDVLVTRANGRVDRYRLHPVDGLQILLSGRWMQAGLPSDAVSLEVVSS